MTRKGFHYRLEREQIRDYKRLSPEQKLQWLEEIFLFTEMAQSDKARKIRRYFRDGVLPGQEPEEG
ncbi:MAG: hypothetical protein ACAI44_23775 [Candidatus Sericytochromatia bacterium]